MGQNFRDRTDEYFRTLMGLDATDECEDDLRLIHLQLLASSALSASNFELSEIDARGCNEDLLGAGTIERHETCRFRICICDDRCRCLDHILFANGAREWLGALTIGQRKILHLRGGVECMNEWDSTLLRDLLRKET